MKRAAETNRSPTRTKQPSGRSIFAQSCGQPPKSQPDPGQYPGNQGNPRYLKENRSIINTDFDGRRFEKTPAARSHPRESTGIVKHSRPGPAHPSLNGMPVRSVTSSSSADTGQSVTPTQIFQETDSVESQTAPPFLALLASARLASPYLRPSVQRPFALAEVKAALTMGFSLPDLEQMQAYWGRRGIPGSMKTLPIAGESLQAKLGGPIGKGAMGTVIECNTATGMKAFKTPTNARSRYEKPTGMNPLHPNVEGRAMLAAELASLLLPAGCGLVVPKTRMVKIGADFGLLMDKLPGKSRMIRVLHNRSLNTQTDLSGKLSRKLAKHGINARKTLDAIHRHGLQSIRFLRKQDGSMQLRVTGQILHESPSIVAHPDYKRALTWLQLFDFLTGQMDRHSGNILIEEYRDPETGEQRVRIGAIDNECCFGLPTEHSEFARILDTHAFLLPQLPEAIDCEMFEAITQLRISPELALAYLGQQDYVDSLLRRLEILQEHCRKLQENKNVMSAGDWQDFHLPDPASSLWQRESMSVSKEIQLALQPAQ